MPQPSKEILRDFSLIRFYVIMVLTVTYFLVQLITAHFTHSLILQIDAYHMLYNILSLATTIITVKMCQKGASWQNTFGWTRIHVCGVVANICFLSALAFSVTVESIQTMIHVDHHDSMHEPGIVGIVGAVGLVVNLFCYFLIGGYTFYQSSFLDSHEQHHIGDDFVISASVQAYVQRGMRSRRRQGIMSMVRDTFGSILVIIVAILLYSYYDETEVKLDAEVPLTKYIDPCFTILAVLVLTILSYRLARDAGHILLLTIPNHIDVNTLLKELKTTFHEDIDDIHEFHVWQLTPERIVASAHVVLKNRFNYVSMQNNITDFLHNRGISQVTIQPEFVQVNALDGSQKVERGKCFLPCAKDCQEKQCCTMENCLQYNENYQEYMNFDDDNTEQGTSTSSGHTIEVPLTPLKAINDFSSQEDLNEEEDEVTKPMI